MFTVDHFDTLSLAETCQYYDRVLSWHAMRLISCVHRENGSGRCFVFKPDVNA